MGRHKILEEHYLTPNSPLWLPKIDVCLMHGIHPTPPNTFKSSAIPGSTLNPKSHLNINSTDSSCDHLSQVCVRLILFINLLFEEMAYKLGFRNNFVMWGQFL